jgi:hypothetical protein
MRSMSLAVAVFAALTIGSTSAKAQVGVVVGDPAYGSVVTVGQPYYGYASGYSGLAAAPGVTVIGAPRVYTSGYRGVMTPGVVVSSAPVIYGPTYYRRGLFGRRVYRAW